MNFYQLATEMQQQQSVYFMPYNLNADECFVATSIYVFSMHVSVCVPVCVYAEVSLVLNRNHVVRFAVTLLRFLSCFSFPLFSSLILGSLTPILLFLEFFYGFITTFYVQLLHQSQYKFSNDNDVYDCLFQPCLLTFLTRHLLPVECHV